jgi:uncharacterized membrane protein YraQ (UPF0718 family)
MIEENVKKSSFSKEDPPIRQLKITELLIGFFLFLVTFYFIYFTFRSLNLHLSRFNTFNTIFIGIIIQAFPFMLVGVFVSAFMNIFISNDTIVKTFPKKYGLGFLSAMFAGVFLPVCECAIVPVTTRLVKKGVSLPVAITFMLSAPIMNPIVILSTLYAFPEMPQIAFYRVLFGLSIAFVIGLYLLFFPESKSVLLDKNESLHFFLNSKPFLRDTLNPSALICKDCDIEHTDKVTTKKKFLTKVNLSFSQIGHEFFDVGKFFIFGALITALLQTFLPREAFSSFGESSALSLLFMMTLAFLFSVCSTSDAFIARSFWYRFSPIPVMGFMVYGPMMDIKAILMLLANFRKAFVIKLTLIITIFSFIMLYIFGSLIF